MINHISIKDFAVIDNVDIDFGPGLSVITGETGSGKSILVTAISLALGSRADSTFIRNGKGKAVVELVADHVDEEIVITREVSSEGKNLCRINGSIVSLGELADTCKSLADIHGQYDNQSLLDPDYHITLVDQYHQQTILPIKEQYALLYNDYQKKKKALNDLLAKESENIQKKDFYQFQLAEINTADPTPGEDIKLTDRLAILQNAEKLSNSINSAYQHLNGSHGAYGELGNAIDSLESISDYSSEIKELLAQTRDLYYQLEDIGTSIRNIQEDMVFSPGEIDNIIERLNLLENLKKKYVSGSGNNKDNINPSDAMSEVLEYRDRIQQELELIENFDEEKERLALQCQEAYDKLKQQGEKLTAARKNSAKELTKKILVELMNLNFAEANMEILFTPLEEPGPDGAETAEILISTNKGEPIKPLSKTSSGGEISRIMLAIRGITAAYDNIPTLIFDEVDQGISGKTAAIVGNKLRDIAKSRQVICITHLPQIASKGDSNYRIYKESDESSTYTHISKLDGEATVQEIARLLGGEEITDAAIQNAKELINQR